MAQMFPQVFSFTYSKDDVDRLRQEHEADPNDVEKKKLYEMARDKSQGDEGERVVFEAFRNKTPDDWMVFHSVSVFGRASRSRERGSAYDPQGRSFLERELDFLVLIPEKGMCVIEVKNYLAEYKDPLPDTDDEPEPNTPAHDIWKRNWPHRQALSAMHDFAHWLEKICGIQGKFEKLLPYACGVLMVGKFAKGHQCQDAPYHDLYLCGRNKIESDNGLKNFVESRLFEYSVPDVDAVNRQIEAIKTKIVSCGVYKKSLQDYEHVLNQAVSRIEHILPMLAKSTDGIEVQGCAGSGKTVMALREASRLAREEKKRVLYLCFNKNLAAWLRRDPIAADIANRHHVAWDGCLDIYNFHDFCKSVLGAEYGADETETLDCESLELFRAKIEQALPNQDVNSLYDYLFVDEAQDFKRGYWEIIKNQDLVPEEGRRFFWDDNQQLRQNQNQAPRPATHIELRTNLRNSQEISKYGASVLNDGSILPLDLPCQQVEVTQAGASVDQRAEFACEIICKRILGNQQVYEKVKMGQIVVLSPWGLKNSANSFLKINECLKRWKKKYEIKENIQLDIPDSERKPLQRLENTLFKNNSHFAFADTIKSFKGLESNYVILTDMPAPSEDITSGFTTKDFYVACSRAKFGLYIIPMNDEAAVAARKHLPQ